jgi:hypothetical protein
MRRMIPVGLCTVAALLASSIAVQAGVFVRAPFVRVITGPPGTYVRAPFVNLWVPGFLPPPPPSYFQPPPWVPGPAPAQTPPPPAADEVAPPPQPMNQGPMTLNDFARSFQARPGNYDVTLINPVTNQPTTVRFTLPDGSPRRVVVRGDELEFLYSRRQFVRIQFDRDGAMVTSRN